MRNLEHSLNIASVVGTRSFAGVCTDAGGELVGITRVVAVAVVTAPSVSAIVLGESDRCCSCKTGGGRNMGSSGREVSRIASERLFEASGSYGNAIEPVQ